jgi:alpha-L-fucosidase
VRGRASDPLSPWYTPNSWWHQRWLDLVTEMIDLYQPDLLYTDGGPPFSPHDIQPGLAAVAHLYNTSAAAHGGRNRAVYAHKEREERLRRIGVFDVERSQEPRVSPVPWQTDTCLGSWFYDAHAVYKTPAHVIELLVDVVAKNGNLLLNVPQLPDGTLDAECHHLLSELAGWMETHGEGIHGTRPFRAGAEGPSGVVIDGFREDRVTWTSADYRFTRRGDTVYAFQMAWPTDRRAVIHSIEPRDEVVEVRLLGADTGALPFTRAGSTGALVVDLPEHAPSRYLTCLAVELG